MSNEFNNVFLNFDVAYAPDFMINSVAFTR